MSVRDKEKFYWWKKDKNYYSNHKIKALEKKKNGYAYSVLLDKIKCESTPYEGILRFSETRAFTIEELSAVVDMPVKLVKSGLEALEELELIRTLECGAIEIIGFTKCVGSETGASIRKREYRNGTSVGQVGDNVPQDLENCPLESRDKSKEIRDKILYLLSSSKLKFIELGLDKEYFAVEPMMIKAAIISECVPSQSRLEEIMSDVVFKDDVFNKQGYLINCFKNEVNTYEHS